MATILSGADAGLASMCLPGMPVHTEVLGDLDLGLVTWLGAGGVPICPACACVRGLVSLGKASNVAGGLTLSAAGKILSNSWPPDTLGPSCGVKTSCGATRCLGGLRAGCTWFLATLSTAARASAWLVAAG